MRGLIGRALDWLKEWILAAALAVASVLAFVQLLAPAWLDFVFDLMMVGLIALASKMHKSKRITTNAPTPPVERNPAGKFRAGRGR